MIFLTGGRPEIVLERSVTAVYLAVRFTARSGRARMRWNANPSGRITGEIVKLQISMVVSGGQTGADWAALDWAIGAGIPHGGWFSVAP